MTVVSKNILRFSEKLFSDLEERTKFIDALGGQEQQSALIWLDKPAPPWKVKATPSWYPDFVTLVSKEVKPGKHQLHDDGAYYCLDPSSVFSAAVLLDIPAPKSAPDMCASPGGKSVFCFRAFKPEQQVTNEVIGKRHGALISNLRRCKVPNVEITQRDPALWGETAPGEFELVVVDAPCSGQSLLVKGEGETGAFHPATINMNANRQKRILANSGKCVAPGGFLAYMTCTFSVQENERVLEWFVKKFPEFIPQESARLLQYRSKFSKLPCYRLFPFDGLGAGGFTALFRKQF